MNKRFWHRNASTILTCVGVVATAVVTAKATIKVVDILDEAEQVKGEKLTTMEKVKLATPSYLPSILLATATIGCGLSAHLLNKKRQTALIGAYALLDQTYQSYRNKVESVYGIEVDEAIRAEIIEEYKASIEEQPELFYDVQSDRFFESTRSAVIEAQVEMNRKLVIHDYLYLNEWYEAIGLEPTDKTNDYGWTTGMCMDMYWQTWIDFTHQKAVSEDGLEYTIVYFHQEPIEGFETYDY